MYEIPSDTDITAVTVTGDSVAGVCPPHIERRSDASLSPEQATDPPTKDPDKTARKKKKAKAS
jgi:hypothetical protein